MTLTNRNRPEKRRRLTLSFATALAVGLAALAPSLSGAALATPKFENSMGQRTLACTGCHGEQGRAAPDGFYPRLAGKPAGYLHHQLLNFRDGRRHYELMTHLVDPLSDAYLLDIARYFSALEVPYPPPEPARVPAHVLQHGENLARNGDPRRQIPPCMQCHGAALTGTAPDIPGLLGLPRDYLNAQIGAWRTGQRRARAPDCMAKIASRLEPADITALTAWMAAQPVPARSSPALALVAPPKDAQAWRCGSAPAVEASQALKAAQP